jgi:hypothetical protein
MGILGRIFDRSPSHETVIVYDSEGRPCAHRKGEDGHCRSGFCWNFECRHPKIGNGHCRDVICWNFEPDIVCDSEGRPCPHTKGSDRHCWIPLCWNSVFADDPEKARVLDAAMTQAVVSSAIAAARKAGVRLEPGDRLPRMERASLREDPMAKFNDRPLPATQEEADQLMADIGSEALGRQVSAPTRD